MRLTVTPIDPVLFAKLPRDKQEEIARLRLKEREQIRRNKLELYHACTEWSPRWTPILEKGVYPLRGQRKAYWESEARFKIVAAGGRSLKTELLKRILVKKAVRSKPHPTEGARRFLFGAPVEDQAKSVGWEDILALCPKNFIRTVNLSELKIILKNTSEIWVAGMDKPARVEGRPWDFIGLTEYADMKPGMWDANIRPLLADRMGEIVIEGRPDRDKKNNDNFEELYNRGLSEDYPDWQSFNWHSEDILEEKEVRDAREVMDLDIYNQEFGGKFIGAAGSAYYQFVRSEHVSDSAVYDSNIPLSVSCDFNIEHHNWGLYQLSNNFYTAFDEIYLRNADVLAMALDLKDRVESLGVTNLVFYGDSSGDNRTAVATTTAWRIVKQVFPNAEYLYRKQPAISDRINEVNGVLKNANGEIRTRIHPKCKNLIKDLEKVTRTMLFTQSKGEDLTHASDNFGYFVCQTKRPNEPVTPMLNFF